MLPKRKFTWASSADSTAVLMRRSAESGQARGDSRPTSRASFAGRRSSLNILSEVKEVVTPPAQSPTGLYERIELTDVLQVGGGRDRDRDTHRGRDRDREEASAGTGGGTAKDPEGTEPNPETASFRDVELAPSPSTATTTVFSEKGDDRFFNYDLVPSPAAPTQAEVHVPRAQTGAGAGAGAGAEVGAAAFQVESPGRMIRATDSLGAEDGGDKKAQGPSASRTRDTRF